MKQKVTGHLPEKILDKILFLGFLLIGNIVFSQNYTVSPTVPDFTDIEADCVVATYGDTDDPFAHEGIVSNRHAVIAQQGTDPYTGGQLKLLPPGETKVVKLGNEEVNREAESLTYHFKVDPEKTVLLLKFAVVFQDPSHPHEAQPRFVVRIMNRSGQLIESCAEYDVSSRPEIEGFQSYDKLGTPIRWRDWTNVGLDMSAYAGEEVQVQLLTYDCDYSAHFGYAYFTASCVSSQLALTACEGDRFSVIAPAGFPSYRWNDGRTVDSTEWLWKAQDMQISCEITSATGCRFTLSAYVSAEAGTPEEPVVYDTICQGEAYTRYLYNLPPQQEAGTFTYTNTYFDLGNCRKSGLSTLYLTVIQRYYPVQAEICAGESYKENGFVYDRPAAGKYKDTLFFPREAVCDSVVVLSLTVYPQVTMKGNIQGDRSPCVGNVSEYKMTEDWEEGSYTWQFPEGFVMLAPQGLPEVTVQVTDAAKKGVVRLMYGLEGCAQGTQPLEVEPRASYWPAVLDTVCSGTEYHDKGFHVPASDSAGVFTFTRYEKTMYGCDSIVTLYLYTFQTPSLSILATDSVICEGESVTLHALGEEAVFEAAPEPLVAVGDILCKSGKVVKLRQYADSGEEAEGVVFWVDPTGRHGWAVDLQDQQNTQQNLWPWLDTYWYNYLNFSGVRDYLNSRVAIGDTAGYTNTKVIRQVCGEEPACPAAQCMDFARGWYLPAAGQMSQLYGVVYEVNATLTRIGGEALPLLLADDGRYWTSTEGSATDAWNMVWSSGFTSANDKGMYAWVRAVKSF